MGEKQNCLRLTLAVRSPCATFLRKPTTQIHKFLRLLETDLGHLGYTIEQ